VLPSKVEEEDNDVDPELGRGEEIVEMGPETDEVSEDIGSGAVVIVVMVVGAIGEVRVDGAEMVGVTDTAEIPVLEVPIVETDELSVVDSGEVTEERVLAGEASVLTA